MCRCPFLRSQAEVLHCDGHVDVAVWFLVCFALPFFGSQFAGYYADGRLAEPRAVVAGVEQFERRGFTDEVELPRLAVNRRRSQACACLDVFQHFLRNWGVLVFPYGVSLCAEVKKVFHCTRRLVFESGNMIFGLKLLASSKSMVA